MNSENLLSRTRDLSKDIMGKFLVAREPSTLLSNFGEIKVSLPPKYSELASAFENNVTALVETIGIPVTLALAATQGRHWQRIHTAQRIRSRMIDANPGESEASLEARRNDHALKTATEKMHDFCSSREGINIIANDACAFLSDSLGDSNLSVAAAELMLQGTVLIWSALEVLTRDLFEAIINSDPKRILLVMQDPAMKQRLQSKYTLEELASVGFDLSSSLGSLLSSQQDFSDIRTIKAALLPALNSDAAVATALGDKRLWVLCQQRHVILHRRGVIDARYLEATGEQRPIGSRLSVTTAELELQIETVISAGSILLSAAVKHAA